MFRRYLVRCPSLPSGGAAVFTESGAFKALTLDFCDALGLPLPALSEATAAALRGVMPDFIPPTNPLDLTAQALVDPGLYGRTLPIILNDDRYGSLVLGIILTDEATSGLKFPPIIDTVRRLKPTKPVLFAGLDEGARVSPEHVQRTPRSGSAVLSIAGARLSRSRPGSPHSPNNKRGIEDSSQEAGLKAGELPMLPTGVIPEYRSKEILAVVLASAFPKAAWRATLKKRR